MAAEAYQFLSFNRGLISALGLARIDLTRTRLSAAIQSNYMPRVLGSMMLRPGLEYIGATASNAAARYIPFVFAKADTALIEFTDSLLRIWISDALLSRVSVSTAITNDTFDSDLTGWTDNDETGAASTWETGGYAKLVGTGTLAAILDQSVAVAAGDRNKEHALRITIERGPVTLSVGTSSSDDSYVTETELQTGIHSLAFTPTGNFNIRFQNLLKRAVLVDSCEIESSGTVTIATPFAASDLDYIRYDQSGDVIFIACVGYTQRRIERRTARSWSIVQYLPEDGPMRVENTGSITLAPAALSGNTTLTASKAFFKSTHATSTDNAGALFRVTSNGQVVTASLGAEDTFSSAIKVTGVAGNRVFKLIRSGTWSATLTLQSSIVSEDGPWTDETPTYTTNGTANIDDEADNQIIWYRVGIKTGGYTSGTAELELNYGGGSIDGYCRVTGYTSSTVVNVEVLTDFGGTDAVKTWAEGDWSDRRGWPTAVAFHEGRLGWAGKGKFWLSASDAYDTFDQFYEGDAGPINRSIGSGPVDTLNWLCSVERLLAGGDACAYSARSTSFDEPLTPSNFNLKYTSGQGAAPVDVLKVDRRVIFVQSSLTRVFELSMEADPSATDYGAIDLTQLVPEVGEPSIVRAAVQRQPDTRLHFVRSDGTAAVMVFDRTENVLAWITVVSDGASGLIEDVVVKPAASGIEDDVYYVVKRTINGSTVRYLEKWALESECAGGAANKQADSFKVFSSPGSATLTGLDHLEGEEVVVWADGLDVGTATSTASSWTYTYTVSGGAITLASEPTDAVVGLPYKSQFESSKLALTAALGSPLTKKKKINGLGMILRNTHEQGLLFGRDFTHMDPLPLVRDGKVIAGTATQSDIDDEAYIFPGEWDTDARICLEARAPRPCTVLALIADAELNERH
jgi:hypothetical protein